jgi:hypothetical protein
MSNIFSTAGLLKLDADSAYEIPPRLFIHASYCFFSSFSVCHCWAFAVAGLIRACLLGFRGCWIDSCLFAGLVFDGAAELGEWE